MRVLLLAALLSGCLESREGMRLDSPDVRDTAATPDTPDTTDIDIDTADTALPPDSGCAPVLAKVGTTWTIENSDLYGVDDQPEHVLIFEGVDLWGVLFDAGGNATEDWLIARQDLSRTTGSWVELEVPVPGLDEWMVIDVRSDIDPSDTTPLALVTGYNVKSSGDYVVVLMGDVSPRILQSGTSGARVATPPNGRTPRAIDGDLVAWTERDASSSRVYLHALSRAETRPLIESEDILSAAQVAGSRVAWLSTTAQGESSVGVWREGSLERFTLAGGVFDFALTREHLYLQGAEVVQVHALSTSSIVATHRIVCAGLTTDGVRALATCSDVATESWPFPVDGAAHLFDGVSVEALPRADSASTVTAPALWGDRATWIELAPDAGCAGTDDLGTVVLADLATGSVQEIAPTLIPCLCCARVWPWPATRVSAQALAWRYGVPTSDPGEDPGAQATFTLVGYGLLETCPPFAP